MLRLQSLLSKGRPLAQLAQVVWSASKQGKIGFVHDGVPKFKHDAVPKFKRFEYDLSRTSSMARFAPAVSPQADGTAGNRNWMPWKPLVFVIAVGASSLGNTVKTEGSDSGDTDAEDGDEDEMDEEQDEGMSERDRRALLKQEVPIPMDPLAWCTKLHLEHRFTQAEICEAHNVAPRTLKRYFGREMLSPACCSLPRLD
jgi:hypothetical protein